MTKIASHAESKTDSKSSIRDAFIKKVQICMNTYNYQDETADVKGKVYFYLTFLKAERLTALNDIQAMLSDQKNVTAHIIPNLEMLMTMIEKNIFRPLPNKKKTSGIGMSETGIEQEEQVDPSWPHLQVFLQCRSK